MSQSTTPSYARFCVVEVSGTPIGYLQDFTWELKADEIEEFTASPSGTPSPAFLGSGNQHISWKANMLWVSANYASYVTMIQNGTVMTVLGAPQGTATGQGNAKITFNNAIAFNFSYKNGQKGVESSEISGKAMTLSTGTW